MADSLEAQQNDTFPPEVPSENTDEPEKRCVQDRISTLAVININHLIMFTPSIVLCHIAYSWLNMKRIGQTQRHMRPQV